VHEQVPSIDSVNPEPGPHDALSVYAACPSYTSFVSPAAKLIIDTFVKTLDIDDVHVPPLELGREES